MYVVGKRTHTHNIFSSGNWKIGKIVFHHGKENFRTNTVKQFVISEIGRTRGNFISLLEFSRKTWLDEQGEKNCLKNFPPKFQHWFSFLFEINDFFTSSFFIFHVLSMCAEFKYICATSLHFPFCSKALYLIEWTNAVNTLFHNRLQLYTFRLAHDCLGWWKKTKSRGKK